MAIMEAVLPVTMLYRGRLAVLGTIGLIPYYWFDRGAGDRARHDQSAEPPMWPFKGATHCGAGCALGDFIGDWLAFALGLHLLGSVLAGKFLIAFVQAYVFGIALQYFSIAPMVQAAMLCGFAMTYPVSWWLIRNGTKE
jgi:hypothetical protein